MIDHLSKQRKSEIEYLPYELYGPTRDEVRALMDEIAELRQRLELAERQSHDAS